MDYQKMYTTLFNAIADAPEAMQRDRDGAAKEILIRAQQETEELYISGEEQGGIPVLFIKGKRIPRGGFKAAPLMTPFAFILAISPQICYYFPRIT